MSIQAMSANTSSIVAQKPKEPGRAPETMDEMVVALPRITTGKETHTSADGKQTITVLKENKLTGEYIISIADKKNPAVRTLMEEKPTIRVVSKKEFDELINGKEKKPFDIEPKIFSAQENKTEGLGGSLSLVNKEGLGGSLSLIA